MPAALLTRMRTWWLPAVVKLSALLKDVPVTVAWPRSLLAVTSNRPTVRPAAPSWPDRVGVSVLVMLSLGGVPKCGVRTMLVAAAGAVVVSVQVEDAEPLPGLPAGSRTAAALTAKT